MHMQVHWKKNRIHGKTSITYLRYFYTKIYHFVFNITIFLIYLKCIKLYVKSIVFKGKELEQACPGIPQGNFSPHLSFSLFSKG